MAIFGLGKENAPELDQDLVLAYLEEALHTRSPIVLRDSRKLEVPALIHSINEEAGTFRLTPSGQFTVEKATKIEFLFFQGGLRIGATALVVDSRTGITVLQLPKALELKERRRQPRARMNPKEQASLTALEGMAEGIGINGTIENISEDGVKVRVEKAISIATEKGMVLGTTLVPPGKAFMLVKLNKVPKCPALIETSGKTVHLGFESNGLVMGLAFTNLRQDQKNSLKDLVTARTTPIPSTLPPKARRRVEKEKEASFEAQDVPIEQTPTPVEPVPPAAENIPPPAGQTAITEVPAPAKPVEPAPSANKSTGLLRMKKNSRTMVVFSEREAQAVALSQFLAFNGFAKVVAVTAADKLLEELSKPNLGVLFLDWTKNTESAMEFIILLREAYEELPPFILAVKEVTYIHRVLFRDFAARSHLIQKPYTCDAELCALIEKLLMQS